MAETTYNMIRIVGSETWLGVDIGNKQLMMEQEGRITVIADFRSTAAAELVDIWFCTIAKRFSPQRQARRIWRLFG